MPATPGLSGVVEISTYPYRLARSRLGAPLEAVAKPLSGHLNTVTSAKPVPAEAGSGEPGRRYFGSDILLIRPWGGCDFRVLAASGFARCVGARAPGRIESEASPRSHGLGNEKVGLPDLRCLRRCLLDSSAV